MGQTLKNIFGPNFYETALIASFCQTLKKRFWTKLLQMFFYFFFQSFGKLIRRGAPLHRPTAATGSLLHGQLAPSAFIFTSIENFHTLGKAFIYFGSLRRQCAHQCKHIKRFAELKMPDHVSIRDERLARRQRCKNHSFTMTT